MKNKKRYLKLLSKMANEESTTYMKETGMKIETIENCDINEVNKLKKSILGLFDELRDSISLANIVTHIPEAKGTFAWGYPHHENIVIWSGLKKEAIFACNEILKEGDWTLDPGTAISYMVDGAVQRLPLAKKPRDYKKPHWLPMFFNKVKHKKASGAFHS